MKNKSKQLCRRVTALLCAALMVLGAVFSDVGTIAIRAEDTPLRTIWDFGTDESLRGPDNGVSFQGRSETVFGLIVDATNGKWDSKSRTDGWVQVNNGTIIKVPVQGACDVAIETYAVGYKVDGQEAAAAVDSFLCEGKDGFVTIEIGAASYLKSIKVTPLKYVAEGTINFRQYDKVEIPAIDGVTFDGMHNPPINDHGPSSDKNGATITLNLSGRANVVVDGCLYSGGKSMTASSGTVTTEDTAGTDGGAKFTVTDAEAGKLTLTFAQSMYVHSVSVEYIKFVEEGTINFREYDNVEIPAIDGVAFDGMHNPPINDHGPSSDRNGATITLNLLKPANVIVDGCTYSSGKSMTASSGTVTTEDTAGTDGGAKFTVTGADAGELTLTFVQSMYVHSITVEYITYVAEGTINFRQYDKTEIPAIDGVTFDGMQNPPINDHGPSSNKDGATITLNLSGRANVVVDGCLYSGGKSMTASSGTVTTEDTAGTDGGAKFTVTGAEAGELTLTFAQSMYVHSITVTYTKDAFVEEGTINFRLYDKVEIPAIDGVAFNGMQNPPINDHGPSSNADGATITLNLSKEANVIVDGCAYSNGKSMTASSGTVTTEDTAGTDGGAKYTVTGAEAGVLTLTFAQSMYVHSITVEYITYVAEGTTDFKQYKDTKIPKIDGITITNMEETPSTDHGPATKGDGATIKLNLSSKASIMVETCCFGAGTSGTMTSSSGTVTQAEVEEGGYKGLQFMIAEAEAGTVTLTFANNMYVHGITVEYVTYVAEGTTNFRQYDKVEIPKIDGITLGNMENPPSTDHGPATKGDGATIKLNLSSKANIMVETCCFGAGASGTMTSSSGTVTQAEVEEGSYKGLQFAIAEAEAGTVTLTFANNMYIHSISVSYLKDTQVAEGKINFQPYDKIEIPDIDGVTLNGLENPPSTGHGPSTKVEGATIILNLSSRANVSVETCCFGAGASGTMTSSSGTVSQTEITEGDGKGLLFTVEGAEAGYVTLSFGRNMYVHSINVSYLKDTFVAEGLTNFRDYQNQDVSQFDGILISGMQNPPSTDHGPSSDTDGATILLNLSERANVIVETCCFGAGSDGKMTASSGTLITKDKAGSDDGPVFIVREADAGYLTLTFTRSVYVHSIKVEYLGLVPQDRKIDVWDFGGKTEADTAVFANNITPSDWIGANVVNTGGVFKGESTGTVVFGDLTLTYDKGDKLYSDAAELAGISAGSSSDSTRSYEDGYQSAGAYYANGAGGNTKRCVTLENVQAGDKIVAYAGIHSGVSGKTASAIHFEYMSEAASQKDTVELKQGEFKKCEFVAEYTGTYKIWENNQCMPMFHRIVRIPSASVSGTIDFGTYSGTEHTLKFVNDTTKDEIVAELNGSDFTATLPAGYTYTAVFSGVTGYAFTDASKVVEVTDEEAVTGKTGVQLVLEEKETITFSGKITGFAAEYDLSEFVATLTPPEGSNLDNVDLTVDENLNFTAIIAPNINYSLGISGVNDYVLKSPLSIEKDVDYTENIVVEAKTVYDVSGKLLDVDPAIVTSLKFQNVDDQYLYEAVLTGDSYSISLRDGAYVAVAEVTGYRTGTHVVVNGKTTEKDLLFVSTGKKENIPWVSDIYVGYSDKEHNYDSVRDAMEACERMAPASEEQRITVHIAPGTYREQVIVAAPYITLINDTPSQDVLLTWYYGIGYKYYSADERGYYNPENAHDKYVKNGDSGKNVDRWGLTVYVKPEATAFRAEGIIFENSFNRYITDEEIADGAEPADSKEGQGKPARTKSLDVNSIAATERGAAIGIEADKTEFKDCQFLSSQDTVYTGNATTHLYFKNCLIEGQTDYIFGDSNIVFDKCRLSWKGYSDSKPKGGYITAGMPSAGTKGYLFRNCTVTANSELNVAGGYFGRPWGKSAGAVYINTVLDSADLIVPAGWSSMSQNTPQNAYFREYNTTVGGNPVDTSKRVTGVMTKEEADAIKDDDYFEGWVPYYYSMKQDLADFAISAIEEKTYGDEAFTLTVEGEEDATGEVTFESDKPEIISISGNTATILKAGTVTITATKAEDNYYNRATAEIEITVGLKALTVKADNKLNIEQGDAMPEFTFTAEGLVNGDTYTNPVITAGTDNTDTTGTFDIVISGGTLDNEESYDVTYVNGRLVIIEKGAPPVGEKKELANFAVTPIAEKTYGDKAFTLSVEGKEDATGEVTFESSNPEIIRINGNTATVLKAGSATITATKAEDDQYYSATANTKVTVNRKELTVTADSQTVLKGSAMPELTFTADGLVNDDTFTNPVITTAAEDTNTVGTFEITISGGTLTNEESYKVTYVKGELKVMGGFDRVAGKNRYDTSIDSADTFKEIMGVEYFEAVVVACGSNFPDALAGSTFASAKDAPVLLVDRSLNDITRNTLKYIHENIKAGGDVYILGGYDVVSEETEQTLLKDGYQVIRIAGKNRYETNLDIVNNMKVSEGTDVIIASGENYPDSIVASGIAGASGIPVILTGSSLSDEAVSKIKEIKPQNVYIVGGKNAVSEKAEEQVKALCNNVERIAGVDRYQTSLEVARKLGDPNADTAIIAYGEDFPDGLTGGTLAAELNAPIILVSKTNYKAQAEYIKNSKIENLYILGGSGVISDDIIKALLGE